MTDTAAAGRPPAVLDPDRRRALARCARRVARAEQSLADARAALAREAAEAAAEGASWRSIGQAIGLSKTATGSLIGRGV
jgi:hypothetical protein